MFTLLDDGLAYVKDGDDVKNDPGGSAGMAAVPEDLEDAVVEAVRGVPRGVHLHRARLIAELRARLGPAARRPRLGPVPRPPTARLRDERPRRGEETGVATMRWSGRTERASMCQVRRSISAVSARPNGPRASSAARSCAVWLMVGR